MQSTGAEPGPVQQELEVLFFASRYVRYDGFGEALLIFKLLIFALLFFEEATSVFFFSFFFTASVKESSRSLVAYFIDNDPSLNTPAD